MYFYSRAWDGLIVCVGQKQMHGMAKLMEEGYNLRDDIRYYEGYTW